MRNGRNFSLGANCGTLETHLMEHSSALSSDFSNEMHFDMPPVALQDHYQHQVFI